MANKKTAQNDLKDHFLGTSESYHRNENKKKITKAYSSSIIF